MKITTALALALAGTLLGCASEIVRSPTILSPLSQSASSSRIELVRQVSVQSSSGYERVLPAGSTWQAQGTVAQGTVYKRVGGIFTIEGAQTHEAFIVISNGQITGYYLPVEAAFSPVSPPVSISFK